MEDGIFAGSEARGPAGLAEGSLTFDGTALHSDVTAGGVAWGAVAPTEIVVTRRLYRDGQSEYLLNGVPSRLRALRLQAAKAERYKRYKGELRDLDLWSASQRFLGHLAEEKSLQAQIAELRETHANQATALEIEEAAVEVERLAVSEEQGELSTAKEALFSLSNKAQLGFQRAQYQEDEAEQLTGRAAAARREIETLAARREECARAIAEIEEQPANAYEEASRSRAPSEEKEQAYEGLRQDLANARRQLDQATAEVSQGLTRPARNESEQAAAAARQEALRARIENVAIEERRAE